MIMITAMDGVWGAFYVKHKIYTVVDHRNVGHKEKSARVINYFFSWFKGPEKPF